MADQAISGLTALGEAPEGRDLIEQVDVSEPVAADRSKRISITQLFNTVITYENDVVFYDDNVVTL